MMNSSIKLFSSVNPGGWAPSIDYKSTLKEIRNQATPSEVYKAKVRTISKIQKSIQRLELVINLNYEKCCKASIRIQRCYRGMKRRVHFNAIRGSLELSKNQMTSKMKSIQLLALGDVVGAIAALDEMLLPSTDMLIMKAKMLYSVKHFERAEEIVKNVIESSPMNEDGHFIYVSCLVSQMRYSDAYEAVRTAMAYFETPRDDILRLYGLICMKMTPPNIIEALEIFDSLVKQRAEDMNALLQRASCYLCVHDWEKAIEDLSVILHYQPKLLNVICLRARAHMCQRDWEKAKSEYKRALRVDADCPTAIDGLKEITQPYVELPMVDMILFNDKAS